MIPSDLQLLKAVRNGLTQLTQQATGATGLIAQIDIAVGELLARANGRASSVKESYTQARVLAARAADLIKGIGDSRLSTGIEIPPLIQSDDLFRIEQAYSDVRQLLVDLLLPLNAAISDRMCDESWHDDVRQLFSDLANLETKRACDDFIPASANGTSETASLDFDRLTLYFAAWPGSKEPLHLLEIRRLSGGFSRETLMAKLRKSAGEEITLILRKQLPGGLLGSSCLNLAGEVPYLKLAHEAGLPVPEVLWHEKDASVLDGEFIITNCMPGATLGTPVSASGTVEEGLLRELAQILAKLHRIDWRDEAQAICASSGVPVAAEISAAQAAMAMCQAFETMWREVSLGPLPTLELVLDWLKRNPPTTARMAMLSHGDIAFHNMMGADGHIYALLDWETARLADPAKDVSMVRNMVKKYMSWETFMDWYRDAGGPAIDEASLAYYAMFNAFTHMLVCELALGVRFAQAENPELEYLLLGLPMRVFFANELLNECTPVWKHGSSAKAGGLIMPLKANMPPVTVRGH